ncbi:MAG: hypothetical protein AMXMBFR33_65460 [Candidatus Xenobia bacterium]
MNLAAPILPSRPPARPAPASPAGPILQAQGDPTERYLGRVAQRALQQLGAMAATTAGLIVGTSLGSIWAVPLGVQSVNLMLMAAGTLGSGLAGAAAGYALSRHLQSPALDLPLTVGGALRGLPRIAYPSLIGATPAEQAKIMSVLDSLPMAEVTSLSTLKVEPRLDTAGLSLPLLSHNHILLDRGHLNGPEHFRDLVTHEVAHTWDFSGGLGPFGSLSGRGAFGSPPYLSSYAGSDRYEDFAETHQLFHRDPARLGALTPDKLEAMRELHRPDLLDRPAVRELGRDLGATLGGVPYLRQGLELAGALVGPLQLVRGASLLQQDDPGARLAGQLQLASGALLLVPGGALPALALNTLSLASPRLAPGALALALGPVGLAGQTLLGKTPLQAPPPPAAGFGSFLLGTASTVLGLGLGSLAGQTLGALVAGPTGAMLGAFWGRLGGAAVGLVGFAALKAAREVPLERAEGLELLRSAAFSLGGALVGAVGGLALGHQASLALGLGPTGAVLVAAAGALGSSWLAGRLYRS